MAGRNISFYRNLVSHESSDESVSSNDQPVHSSGYNFSDNPLLETGQSVNTNGSNSDSDVQNNNNSNVQSNVQRARTRSRGRPRGGVRGRPGRSPRDHINRSSSRSNIHSQAEPQGNIDPLFDETSSLFRGRNRFAMRSDLSSVEVHKLSSFDAKCEFCGALHFAEEKSTTSATRGKFMLCCQAGKVRINPPFAVPPAPEIFVKLMTHSPSNCQTCGGQERSNPDCSDYRRGKNFLDNIRQFNNSFAMASLCVKESIPLIYPPLGQNDSGVRVIRLNGQCYTAIADPDPNERHPKYTSLYFFDPREANQKRLSLPSNSNMNPDLTDEILTWLQNNNTFVRSFTTMYEKFKSLQEQGRVQEGMPAVTMHFVKTNDNRTYNVPSSDEIAVISTSSDTDREIFFSISAPRITPVGSSELRNLHHSHPHVDPMTYPLLFPRGTFGWKPEMRQSGTRETTVRKNMTIREFYCHRIARREEFSILHKSLHLTQQFYCDIYMRIEISNLRWLRNNQQQLRGESYRVLLDTVAHTDEPQEQPPERVGRRMILPATFHGSPRYMYQLYQDAMAMVAKYGIPDYFITFTCSTEWVEIKQIEPNYSNAFDLYARVFNLKCKALIKDLTVNKALGEVVAYTYSIEWQKRGMPHMHLLLTVREEDKPRTSEQVDRVVWARIPATDENPALRQLVEKYMIHGPCGTTDPNRTCMIDGKCSKHFPKNFSEETIVDGITGYPIYKRPSDGTEISKRVGSRVAVLDNRNVVPYNPALLLRYRAHINVEVCNTVWAIKYIYKYCFKGNDMATVRQSIQNHNEIEAYKTGRFVSGSEAVWRILSFKTDDSSHTVIALPVHLENEQFITFAEGEEQAAIDNAKPTMLQAFFQLNNQATSVQNITYLDVPFFYTFENNGQWKRRVNTKHNLVTRIHTVSPRDQERFALRLLLQHIPSPKSFNDLKIINGTQYATFNEAAQAYGLVVNSAIWHNTMDELCRSSMPGRIRSAFALILAYNNPPDALNLYNTFKLNMIDDFTRNNRMSVEDATQRLLVYLERILNANNTTLSRYRIPLPDSQSMAMYNDNEQQSNISLSDLPEMNNDQRRIFDAIMNAIYHPESTRNKVHFVDGPGGTGKTTMYKHLIRSVTELDKEVIAGAHTGIAAQLLPNGFTIHSTFGVPLQITERSTSWLTPNCDRAQVIKDCSLIIWDEAPMSSSDMLRIVDDLLRDLMQTTEPFGVKVVVLGGDFRQVLPIVKGGGRPEQINACITKSNLWQYFQVHTLTNNMRASSDILYAEWLLKLGEDKLEKLPDSNLSFIPETFFTSDPIEDFVFTRSLTSDEMISYLDKVILAVTNRRCNEINEKVLQRLQSPTSRTYTSIDSAELGSDFDSLDFPPEFLNTLSDGSLPPHELNLKVGAIVMLLRNIDKTNGLLNGTRVIVTALYDYFIEVKTANGDLHSVPMCDLRSSPNNFPFELVRRQFPVRLAFAITINKSQGQTFAKVGLCLSTPVFSHGMLYVAMSRVRSSQDIGIWIDPSKGHNRPGYKKINGKSYVRNIVWPEVLNIRH